MPINDDEVKCPWCVWRIDRTVHPMSDRSAERRLTHHKAHCPNRRSQSHRRSHVDVHGESVFEDNAGQ